MTDEMASGFISLSIAIMVFSLVYLCFFMGPTLDQNEVVSIAGGWMAAIILYIIGACILGIKPNI